MGAEPAAGGTDQWFGYYEDTVVDDPCSEADHAFLAGLRARAVSGEWFERLLTWPIERREWLVVLVRGHRDRRARVAKKCRRTPSWPWRRRGGA